MASGSSLRPTMTAASGVSSVVVASRFVIQVALDSSVGAGTQGTIAFSELTGITSEVEPAEYFSSSTTGVSLTKQFGKTKPATVTLKRGLDDSPLMWSWHQAVLDGNPNARSTSCSLLLQDTMGQALATYQLRNAWPSKLELGGMKAGVSEVVIATAVLVCDQIVFSTSSATGVAQ